LERAEQEGIAALALFAPQQFNVEIGIALPLRWLSRGGIETGLTLSAILEPLEDRTIGTDGGGLGEFARFSLDFPISAFVARSPSRSASPLTARSRRTTRAAAGHLLERPVDQFALDHRRSCWYSAVSRGYVGGGSGHPHIRKERGGRPLG
jgi:hypothetical protein